MPTTPNRQYPYPALSSANDPPRDLQLLAEALDADVTALMNAAPISPVYEAGWGPYDPSGLGTYLPVTVTRSAAGLVGLSGMGMRTGSTIASGTAEQHVLNLPEGYRPSKQILILIKGGGGYADQRVDIYPDGRLTIRWIVAATWANPGGWFSLAGLSFVAAS